MRSVTLCTMLALAAPCAMLLAPLPAMADASLSATAQSGVKTKVSEHGAFSKSCTPQRVVVKITTPPANGDVTTTQENIVMPAVTKLGGANRCAGSSGPEAVLYYQSKAGFKGKDTFKYQRTNLDNAKDKLNGEITFTVTVQ